MPYDPDSGLVFSETKITRKRNEELERERRCIGRRPEYIPPADGPATLVELAMLKILRSLDILEVDSLSTVPPTLLESIWKAIVRSQLDSLRVWKLFAKSDIGQRSILQARRPLLLPSIAKAIAHSSSTDCSWITSLEITKPQVSLVELVSVSGLDNLRSFLMTTTRSTSADTGVHDRVLRSWAEAVRERGALQQLRFIFLYFQLGVTKWSLPHLDAFPKLDEFCAYQCGIQWADIKRRQGWRKKPEGSFFTFAKASVAYKQQTKNYTGTCFDRPPSWNNLVVDYVCKELSSSNDDIDRRPLLRARVGEGSMDVSHPLDHPPAIVCLKRGTEPHLVKEEIPVERRNSRPLVKKRKIVFDSGDLDSMLGG